MGQINHFLLFLPQQNLNKLRYSHYVQLKRYTSSHNFFLHSEVILCHKSCFVFDDFQSKEEVSVRILRLSQRFLPFDVYAFCISEPTEYDGVSFPSLDNQVGLWIKKKGDYLWWACPNQVSPLKEGELRGMFSWTLEEKAIILW